MNNPSPDVHVLRFGVFELDTRSGELRRHGLKVRLPDQSFQILNALLDQPGSVVTREELRHRLWPTGTFVDFEVGLNSAVRKLREALQDSAENPRFVETLPRRGYRFVASVTAAGHPIRVEAGPDEPRGQESSGLVEQRSHPWSAAAATSREPPRLAALVGAGLLLALGGGGASVMYPRRADPAADAIRSVVVLPFENLTGDAAEDYLADSVTEAITVHLAQVDGLDVISRTSAGHYKQTAKRLPEIGRELSVDGAVAGTVTRAGTRASVTVRLHRTAAEDHVWSASYEGEIVEMMALQRRIASEIAVAAGRAARPTVADRSARRIDPAAYDAYVRGLTAMGAARAEGFQRSVAYFEDAVTIQPDFAEAHAALAHAQLQFLYGGPLAPHQVIPKAEAAARKALQLDDTLGLAHRVLGQIFRLYYWRWEEGDKELQRAAALGDLAAVSGTYLVRQGRAAEAITAAERARKLDPLSLNAQLAVAAACRAAGQHERAIHELRQALQMSPGQNRVHFQLGVTYVAMGRLDAAIRELEAAARPAHGHNSRIEAYLGYAYAAARRREDARRVLLELEAHRREQYVSWFGIALIHDALGEKGPALAAIQRAHEEHAVEFAQLDQYPPFRAVAAEPAFQAVMRQVGAGR